MESKVLEAQLRTEFGKGAARRVRREDKVPAVIYGHGIDPVHVCLPGHDSMMAVKTKNALLTIKVEDGTEHLVVVKNVQREVIRRYIEHIDLLVVRRGEKIEVEVPVHATGEPGPGSLVTQEGSTILLLAEATHIPEQVVVDLEGLAAGTIITAADLNLPEGTELVDESDFVVFNISHRSAASESDDESEDGDSTEDAAAE